MSLLTRRGAGDVATYAATDEAATGSVAHAIEVEHVIEVDDATVRYGSHTALDRVSLSAQRGRITALLGPNGAGKTTMVDLLQGFIKPDSGRVIVLGANPWRAHPGWRNRIGAVLQDTRLDADLTVGEFVEMTRSWYRRPHSSESVLQAVGLQHLSGRRVHKLSGGERRRLDLGVATIGRPDLLFLDEPTTGLDPQARREVWELLLAMREHGQSILLTSHDMAEVERLADDIWILQNGRILAHGDVDSLTRQHRNEVEGFRGAHATFEDVYLHLLRGNTPSAALADDKESV